MTRDEAIKEIDDLRCDIGSAYDDANSSPIWNALGMAIDALKHPRQQCIAKIKLPEEELEKIFQKILHEHVQVFPSERKTGKWIRRHSKMWECSECERGCRWRENFCPDCGARMEVDE